MFGRGAVTMGDRRDTRKAEAAQPAGGSMLPPYVYDAGEHTTYELLDELRRGGEGRIFHARQIGDAGRVRPVALKILTPQDHLGAAVEPADVLKLWREQVQVMRSFAHAGFASVHVAFPLAELPELEADETPPWVGLPAFVMAWIDGISLDDWRTPARTQRENLAVLEPCAAGLDAFHRSTGHVHRDLKPANIVVAGDGARVVDYGLVRSIEQLRSQSHLIGTPGYIAPELFSGAEYTPATDLYAFAGIMFYQLTGRHPTIAQQMGFVRTAINDAGCPAAGQVLASALAPAPQSRAGFVGAGDMLQQVLATLERQPTTRIAPPRPPPAPPTRRVIRRPPEPKPTAPALRALVLALVLCALTVIVIVVLINH